MPAWWCTLLAVPGLDTCSAMDQLHIKEHCTTCCLQDAAELLAAKADWGPLYDIAVLRKNQVPVASATYFEVTSFVTGPAMLLHVLICVLIHML